MRRKDWDVWTAVALIGGAFALLAPAIFAHRAFPFDSDEAVHALGGLRAAADVRRGDWTALVQHLYFRPWYPPGLPFILAPFLVVLGPAYWAARYPVLLILLLDIALLYRVGGLIARRRHAGLVPAVLGATSPVLWLHALLTMEDLLGAAALLLVAGAVALAERGRVAWPWVGGLAALAFLARTSTGGFVAAALLATCWLGRDGLRQKARRTVQIVGPVVGAALFWWGHPYKFQGAIDYFQASTPQFAEFDLRAVTHYWALLVDAFAAGWGIAWVMVAGMGLAATRWRRADSCFPLSLLLITWIGLLVKRQIAVRLIIPGAMAAFLLSAPVVPALADALRGHRTFLRLALAVTLVSVLAAVGVRIATLPLLLDVGLEARPSFDEARDWIARHVGSGPVFLVNGWDVFSAPALEWALAARAWPDWTGHPVVNIDLADPEDHPEEVEAFAEMVLGGPEATIVHLENTPVPAAGAWWAYAQAISPCWDGSWEATATFVLGRWDSQLLEDILSHPIRFATEEAQAAARQKYWYPLPVEMHIATCR